MTIHHVATLVKFITFCGDAFQYRFQKWNKKKSFASNVWDFLTEQWESFVKSLYFSDLGKALGIPHFGTLVDISQKVIKEAMAYGVKKYSNYTLEKTGLYNNYYQPYQFGKYIDGWQMTKWDLNLNT
eukprot:986295_1